MTVRNLVAAVLLAVSLTLSGVAIGIAAAQQVPVLGENGWVLPENDDSSFSVNHAPAQPAVQSGGYGPMVEQWRPAVESACAVHGCDPNQLMGVIACESGGNPGAVGPNGELGILQVDPTYWGQMSSAQQIDFAARDFADGYGDKWVCQGW